MTVQVSFKMEIDKSDFDKLKRLEHHIEELIDLDAWPEIHTVWDVKLNKCKE